MIRIFSHWVPANALYRRAFDLVLFGLFLALAGAWIDRGDLGGTSGALSYVLPFGLGVIAVNLLLGIGRRKPDRTTIRTWGSVILFFLLVAPMAYGVSGFVPHPAAGRGEWELAALLALGLMVAIRGRVASGIGLLPPRRVLVLGTGAEAAEVEQSLIRSGSDVRIVGFYPVPSDQPNHVVQDRILAGSVELADLTRELKVDEVIIAVRERRAGVLPLRELLSCKSAGIRVLDLSSHFERTHGQVHLDSLHASWLVFGDGFRQGWGRSVVKRLFDVVAAGLLLGVFWPLMLLSAILVVLDSGFPILYRQPRVGQGGHLFQVLKFRSMRSDAEQDGKPRWAAPNDERITRIGNILRRLRLDELPQLFNVLKGEMSLVGPRPERPYFVARLARTIPFYATRHSVKPGVTGWAQVRYGYGASVEDAAQKLQYDLYYVKNHTLFLDTAILFRTVGVVLRGVSAPWSARNQE